MPFDAGTIDVTPTRRVLHLSYIDSEGKPRTDSYDIPTAATDAELNALTLAIGSKSNASLWDVAVTNHFAVGLPSKANADNVPNDSVADNVVLLFKTLDNQSFDLFIPANIEEFTMVENTENPDPALLAPVVAAAVAVWPTYDVISYRMSERRKKNRSIKA